MFRAWRVCPGGRTVDISYKRLPRLGPAEPGTAYQTGTWSFDVQQVPVTVPLPGDTEEVVICLHGALQGTLHKDLLMDELDAIFSQAQFNEEWDLRVNFRENIDRPPRYELKVFPHHSSPSGIDARVC